MICTMCIRRVKPIKTFVYTHISNLICVYKQYSTLNYSCAKPFTFHLDAKTLPIQAHIHQYISTITNRDICMHVCRCSVCMWLYVCVCVFKVHVCAARVLNIQYKWRYIQNYIDEVNLVDVITWKRPLRKT